MQNGSQQYGAGGGGLTQPQQSCAMPGSMYVPERRTQHRIKSAPSAAPSPAPIATPTYPPRNQESCSLAKLQQLTYEHPSTNAPHTLSAVATPSPGANLPSLKQYQRPSPSPAPSRTPKHTVSHLPAYNAFMNPASRMYSPYQYGQYVPPHRQTTLTPGQANSAMDYDYMAAYVAHNAMLNLTPPAQVAYPQQTSAAEAAAAATRLPTTDPRLVPHQFDPAPPGPQSAQGQPGGAPPPSLNPYYTYYNSMGR